MQQCRTDNKVLRNLQQLETNSISKVKEKYSSDLMKIPLVVGVGIEKEGKKYIVKILVSKKTKTLLEKIPKKIEGYNVKVEEVGEIYSQE